MSDCVCGGQGCASCDWNAGIRLPERACPAGICWGGVLQARLEASEAEAKRLRLANDSLLTVNLEAVHERDDANVAAASLRSQLAAMTEALRPVFHDLSSSIGLLAVSVLKNEEGLRRRLQAAMERFEAALSSPTSSKEWEEKIRADERKRCAEAAEAFRPPACDEPSVGYWKSRGAAEAADAIRSLAKEKKT